VIVRTTITLDPDVEALVRRAMRERGASFKQVVNETLRSGFGPQEGANDAPFRTPTFRMGFDPSLDLVKALRMAAEQEDEELLRKLAQRK
jgi:hypothetical protein